jgi:hypothetical protein
MTKARTAEAKADLEDLAQYILRNPFSVEKMTLKSPTDMVIYRSRLNAKINRNFEVFTATDFLAAITQHIPDKGAQMVRYYGWYSNKMRGVRHRGLPPDLVPHRPGLSLPPPIKLPSKRWRDLILRVWHVDRLRCPSSLGGDFNSSFILHLSSFPPAILRPGLPQNHATSRAWPGRSAAAARPCSGLGDGAKPPETWQ